MHRFKIRLLVVALACFAVIASACSKGSDTPSSGSPAASGSGGTTTQGCQPDQVTSGGGSASGATLLDQVISAGTLTVSTDPKYPPASKLDPTTGTWQGFDIDVACEMATRLGNLKVSFVTPPWNTITAGNWQDRWAMSVGSMTIEPDREEVLDFTNPYYYTPAAIAVYKTNTDITGPADLTGKPVGACGGCTYDQYLQGTLKLADSAPPFQFQVHGAEVKTYDTDTTAIQDLAKGDCISLCAAVSALPILEQAIKDGAPIKIVGDPLYYEPLGIAIDKEAPANPDTLVAKATDIVDAMHQDGTLSDLSCKYFGVDLTVTDPADAKTC